MEWNKSTKGSCKRSICIGRNLLDVLFSKPEQKFGILFESDKTNKPPLDLERVTFTFRYFLTLYFCLYAFNVYFPSLQTVSRQDTMKITNIRHLYRHSIRNAEMRKSNYNNYDFFVEVFFCCITICCLTLIFLKSYL